MLGDGGPPTQERVYYRNQRTKMLSVLGTTERWPDVVRVPLAAGRFFTSGEVERRRAVVVLGQTAVQALFPGTQITFGPSTEDGFYYDVMAPESHGPFTLDDLPLIEEKMREIIRADKPLRREVMARDALIETWTKAGESFKAEWAKELPEGEELSVYWSGDDWMDMCRGPHLASTGKLDPAAFKLTRVAGAYWRGDQNNAQLSRIYGTGWLNKKQLDAHLVRLEEAAKRDHRRLGQDMDLFHLQQEAHGSVFWHPHGFTIWRQLEAYMRRAIDDAGYREIKTPQGPGTSPNDPAAIEKELMTAVKPLVESKYRVLTGRALERCFA